MGWKYKFIWVKKKLWHPCTREVFKKLVEMHIRRELHMVFQMYLPQKRMTLRSLTTVGGCSVWYFRHCLQSVHPCSAPKSSFLLMCRQQQWFLPPRGTPQLYSWHLALDWPKPKYCRACGEWTSGSDIFLYLCLSKNKSTRKCWNSKTNIELDSLVKDKGTSNCPCG